MRREQRSGRVRFSGMEGGPKNRVLRSLAPGTRRAVLDACERVEFDAGTVLAHTGDQTPALHFPETAVISTLASYRDGSTIEMANVGREGCTGIGLILGDGRQLNTNQVQIGGTALTLAPQALEPLRRDYRDFERVLLSVVQAIFYQVLVSGACNGAHSARQRLARWLLTMSDRSDDDTMPLTQEFLSHMLGVRRPTVTQAAAELQREGRIDYARGRIRVLDQDALREASCECYDLVRSAYDTLLPETGCGD
jgi:CRP-like cAMP-binding protein